jgi:hypothetical protein
MSVVDKYLNTLNEQYNVSVVKANVHGDYQNQWTECYNSRCLGFGEETKYEKAYCKTVCQIAAANRAKSTLNGEKSNCAQTRDPKRCLDSLKSAVDRYQDKITKAREMQDQIAAKRAEFRRKAAGG